MENSNSKTVMVSFISAAILTWIVVGVLMQTMTAVATGGFGRAVSQDWARHGIPVLAGLAVFIALQSNARVRTWADEVVSELARIVWPSRKDTVSMTVVVCIMLLISGLLLGLMDIVSGEVIKWLLNHDFGIF